VGDVARLPGKWRRQARAAGKRANELGNCRAGLELATEASVRDQCADELEQDYHDDHHDGEFEQGCRFCDAEREKYS
jgi:hypothetical protein